MKVWPITQPLDGEHIVAVTPPLSPDTDAGWNRRLNLFTGRSLSDTALKAEQAGRAGRLALRGQMVSPGVVSGLQLTIERQTPEIRDGGDETLSIVGQVSAGLGIAVTGEDVVVPTDLQFDLRQVRVYAPGGLLAGAIPEDQRPNSGLSAYGWDIGPRLGAYMQPDNKLPRVGVLVLQPIVVDLVGRMDAADPCEMAPSNDPFADWQLADGTRVVYYAWPDALGPQIPPSTPDGLQRWRNRVAYAIFAAEETRGPDEPLPWELAGVPIGVAAFDVNWQLQFTDRNSVVRMGGHPRRRSRMHNGWRPDVEQYFSGALPAVYNPYLWQARMQQFAEQVADAYLTGESVNSIAAQFTSLPPAGLLPVDAVSFLLGDAAVTDRADRQHIFPVTYAVDAVPVPLEQLDLAMATSASLAPFEVSASDQVRLLVPVPQAWYEPGLLLVEQVDPEFQQTLDQFVARRGRWLSRRRDVREKHAALAKALSGQATNYPLVDPAALESSEDEYLPVDMGDPQLKDPETAYGTARRDGILVVTALEDLRQKLLNGFPLRRGSAVTLSDLREDIAARLRDVEPRIAWNANQKQLTFQGVLSPDKRDQLKRLVLDMDGSETVSKALDDLQTASLRDEVGQLDVLGLTRFIAYLDAKVRQADDRVDFGFLRIQTDIYRVRQLMLGTTTGTRLAVSPTLATIAQGTSAASTRSNLRTFYDQLKGSSTITTPPARSVAPADAAVDAGVPVGLAGTPPAATAVKDSVFGSISNLAFAPRGESLSPGASLIELSGTQLGDSLIKKQSVSDLVISAVQAGNVGVLKPSVGAAAPIDVIGQAPLIGGIDLRTATVAERLEPPKAPETKDFSVASKHEVVSALAELAQSQDGMNLDDIVIPGVPARDVNNDIVFGDPAKGEMDWLPKRVTRPLKDILLDRDVLQEPSPRRSDEAAYFVSSVELLDHTIAALRGTEGRVQAYRVAIATCQKTLAELQDQLGQAASRLQTIGNELAEARHDVSLARALLADEQTRVSAINNRRDQIIREHVSFLAYHRPRVTELRRNAISRPLIPVTEANVPATCLALRITPPDQLRALVDLFRETPVKWFTQMPQLLDMIDVLPALHATLAGAKARAFVKSGALTELLGAAQSVSAFSTQVMQQSSAIAFSSSKSELLGSAISRVFVSQQTAIQQIRGTMAQFDLGAVTNQNWRRVRDQATDVLSLGDLISGEHGRSRVAQAASQELDDITHVAACLYQAFDRVLPVIRLEWAELLSQYDAPADLRDLVTLPRWGQIDFLERRQMQGLIDWLYGRIDTSQTGALSLMNDLVRVCILLASHAPVNQIIAGHLPKLTTVTPGIRFDLAAVNLTQVNVGMQVLLFDQDKMVARAIVDDLSAGQVSAKVTELTALDAMGQVAKSMTLPAGTRAQFLRHPL